MAKYFKYIILFVLIKAGICMEFEHFIIVFSNYEIPNRYVGMGLNFVDIGG